MPNAMARREVRMLPALCSWVSTRQPPRSPCHEAGGVWGCSRTCHQHPLGFFSLSTLGISAPRICPFVSFTVPLANSFLKSSLDVPQNLVLPWLWTCSSPPCLLQLMRGFWGRDCPSAPRETAPCSPLAFGEQRADGDVNNLSHLVVIPIKANCN